MVTPDVFLGFLGGVEGVEVLVCAKVEEGAECFRTEVAPILSLVLVRLNVTHEGVQLAIRFLTRPVNTLVYLQIKLRSECRTV